MKPIFLIIIVLALLVVVATVLMMGSGGPQETAPEGAEPLSQPRSPPSSQKTPMPQTPPQTSQASSFTVSEAFDLLEQRAGKDLCLVGYMTTSMGADGRSSDFSISGCQHGSRSLYILSVSLGEEPELSEHTTGDQCVDYFGADFQDSPAVLQTIGKSCSKNMGYSMTEMYEHPFGNIACLVSGAGWSVDYDFAERAVGDRDDYA